MTVGPEGTIGVYLDGCPLMLCSPVRRPQGQRDTFVINWCQWDIHNGMEVVQARQHLLKVAPMLYLYGDAYAFPYKHNTFWDKGQLSSIQAAACSLPLPVPSIDG